MNYKAIIFVLLLSGAGFYFYKNGETSNLIIVSLLAIFVFLFAEKNEHMNSDNIIAPEALQSLASMFNDGHLIVSKLTLTNGDLTIEKGNLNAHRSKC
jgi:hypothetical protein